MIATASAIVAGAIPVPIDCGNDHMIDVAKIESAITEKTIGMPTQLMEEFVKWMQFLRSQINKFRNI